MTMTLKETTCRVCGLPNGMAAEALGVCRNCLRRRPDEALPLAMAVHGRIRSRLALPPDPPRDPAGVSCKLCVNACRMAKNAVGYCGLRRTPGPARDHVAAGRGKLSWYHDPLPTNCVADWVCAGGTGAGYPDYAHCRGAERGFRNLAVFFHGCSFNCLYCQNWDHKQRAADPEIRSARELAAAVDRRTSCICFFGGDPTPQLPFSIRAARIARARADGRILRFCWETNGSMNPRLLDRIMDLAVLSGGCVKFDLKAWNENLHKALTGVSNRRTLANFRRAAKRIPERPLPPPLVASTLLVPGYVDVEEIHQLARFIAGIDPAIPYALLAFYPQFAMAGHYLPTRAYAHACRQAAYQAGLTKVRIGNQHLLTA